MEKVKMSQKLTESALMLAMATILSFIKIVELPFGGSITLASMLPMVILSYRYGFSWGLLSGFVYSLIQLLFGLNNLSYATSFFAAVAIILLDYVIAFACTAVGGLFRKMNSASAALTLGALAACVIRFFCHTLSGCTVWAGVSVPTGDAFLYSLVYNAAYMVPETVITVITAVYISSALDFSQPNLAPAKKQNVPDFARVISVVSGIVSFSAIIVTAVFVFPSIQNENGFDITGIVNVNPVSVVIPLVIAAAGLAVMIIFRTGFKEKKTA